MGRSGGVGAGTVVHGASDRVLATHRIVSKGEWRLCCKGVPLTCGVPNLKFRDFAVLLNRFDLEINPDGRNELRSVRIIGEPSEDAALAYSGISDQKKLVQMIAAKPEYMDVMHVTTRNVIFDVAMEAQKAKPLHVDRRAPRSQVFEQKPCPDQLVNQSHG